MAHQVNADLIEILLYCQTACEHCADASLSEDNISRMVECIRLDRDWPIFVLWLFNMCPDILNVHLLFWSYAPILAKHALKNVKNMIMTTARIVQKPVGRQCAEACRKAFATTA